MCKLNNHRCNSYQDNHIQHPHERRRLSKSGKNSKVANNSHRYPNYLPPLFPYSSGSRKSGKKSYKVKVGKFREYGSSDTHEIYFKDKKSKSARFYPRPSPRMNNLLNSPTYHIFIPTTEPSSGPTPSVTTVSPTLSPILDTLSPIFTTSCPINSHLPDGKKIHTQNQILIFQYAIKTSSNSNTHNILDDMEKSLAHYLAKHKLDCNNRSYHSIFSPVVISIEPNPSDSFLIEDTYCNIKACCSPNCSLLSGSITITEAHHNPEKSSENPYQCHIFETIVEYMNTLKPGDIAGLNRVYFIGTEGVLADGQFQRSECADISRIGDNVSDIITSEIFDTKKNPIHMVLWPGVSLLLLIGLMSVYIQRLNKLQKSKNDDNRINPILGRTFDDTTIASEFTSPSFTPNMISDLHTTIDVKKCDSALCHTCQLKDGTEFINVNDCDHEFQKEEVNMSYQFDYFRNKMDMFSEEMSIGSI